MIELYKKFFFIFLHPIRSLKFSVEKNVIPEYPGSSPFMLVKEHEDGKEISLLEAVLLAWPFYFISIFYKFIYNTFFHIHFKHFSIENDLISSFTSSIQPYLIMYDNYSLLFKFVFFPLVLFFYFRIWKFILIFSCELLSPDESQRSADQIIIHSFVSHIFLIIPIFGTVMTFLSHIIFIYLGVRNSLKYNRIQSLFVIATPLLAMLFFFFISFLLYALIIILS